MASAQPTVQRASLTHADEVFSLVEEYYEAVQVVARDDRGTLLDHLSRPDSGVWVAYWSGVPAGCILYHPLPEMPASAEVKRLYVRPEFRRRGIAQELLTNLERFAATQPVHWLYLDTKDDLPEALAFYERNGYLRCPRYNTNPQATIFMRKRLSPIELL